MFNLIRKTHLLSALILFLFVLLYAVSGYVLEFPKAWNLSPGPTTTRTEAFHYAGDLDSPDAAEYLKETYDLHGRVRVMPTDMKTGTRYYYFIGPMGFYNVMVPRNADHVTIQMQFNGFFGVLNRLHHLSGFEGGGIYQIWGVMFDLVCLSMILFSLSGIYLWYKLTKRHTLGWIILAASIGYTAATAIYCITAR